MKKYIYVFAILFICGNFTIAQGAPNNPTTSIITGNKRIEKTFNGNDYTQKITYYDGLGRPIQSIDMGASPNGYDIVQLLSYDCMGRSDSVSYLPYVINSNGGIKRTMGLAELQGFYSNLATSNSITGSQTQKLDYDYAYSLKIYEKTPEGLISQESKPGFWYSANSPSGHSILISRRKIGTRKLFPKRKGDEPICESLDSCGIEFTPEISAPSSVIAIFDTVKRFSVNRNNNLLYNGFYSRSSLVIEEKKQDISDDNDISKKEYKNREGQVIAKSIQSRYDQKQFTYYVFDDFGLLRYIIPHSISSQIETKGIVSDNQTKECYRFDYDDAGNKIRSFSPEAKPVYYIYDNRNRLICSQDGNLRSLDQWLYNQYDDFDRIIGVYIIAFNFGAHEGTLREKFKDISGSKADEIMASSVRNKIRLQSTFYGTNCDNILNNQISTNIAEGDKLKTLTRISPDSKILQPIEPIFSLDSASNIISPINEKDSTDTLLSHDSKELTRIDSLNVIPIIITRSASGRIPIYLAFSPIAEVVSEADVYDNNIGLKIYEKVAILPSIFTDSLAYIERAYYYDAKGRIIQSVIKNHLGGITRISEKYNYIGNVLQHSEIRQSSKNADPDIINTVYTYDDHGRVLSMRTKMNDSPEAIISYNYDQLGRCIETVSGNGIIHDKYKYDISGQIIQQDNNAFSMILRNTEPKMSGSIAYFDGKMSEVNWINKGDDSTSYTYSYAYTPLGYLSGARLFHGDKLIDDFTEKDILYDINGNILKMKRYENGNKKNDYSYTYSGDRLMTLSDDVTNTQYHFEYDSNGNMSEDGRNNWKFEYNHLNLLQEISDSNNHQIANYLYLADGTKIGATNSMNNGLIYLGSLVYQQLGESIILESFGFDGGRIVKTSSGYSIQYYATDYLHSVRAVIDEEGKQIDHMNYYPFGLKWVKPESEVTTNRYLFNGKESQMTFNLNVLDYGARMYDPTIGRWFVPDPAKQLMNPYVFCGNNPVINIDEDGQFFLSFLFGFFKGVIKWENPFIAGAKNVINEVKIINGLFKGSFWDIVSRLTWQFPQTALGMTTALGANLIKDVDVSYAYGATVTRVAGERWGAFTLSSYILGDGSIRATPTNSLFQHEYGHYLQSKSWGPFYLGKVAIPSLFSAMSGNNHNAYKTEQDANIRALEFWEDKFPGFSSNGWNQTKNDITGYNWDKGFNSEINSSARDNGRMNGIGFIDLLPIIFPHPLGIGICTPRAPVIGALNY